MTRIKAVLFSNGTEHMTWTGLNCERCWKQSRFNVKRNEFTQFRCSIDKEITLQSAGIIDDGTTTLKAYEAVQKVECPYREEKQKVKKHRPVKGMNSLFNDE